MLGATLLFAFPWGLDAQVKPDGDPPPLEQITAQTDITVVPPTNTFYGTRGLSQTNSAETLGEGRLIFGVNGSWYQQQRAISGAPDVDANIFTGIGAAAFGLNRFVDLFASLSGYGSTDYHNSHASGLGAVGGGLQVTLPYTDDAPLRFAAQGAVLEGLSDNPIDANRADGYDYFETRTGLDFMGKLIETLIAGNESLGLMMHFNEGLVTSQESGTKALILLGAGVQMNLLATVLGVELHSRSLASSYNISEDPFWITPSVQFRSPFYMNVLLGADISLSQDRSGPGAVRALEPYRLFAGLNFTFDTQANRRREAKERAMQAEQEKRQLAQKAYQDSVAREREKAVSDSLAAKAKQDSIALAQKASLDSAALVETRKNLQAEIAKRTEAEKQLLSTGLLLLDAVYFETGKTDISINSKPYLNIIAKMLTKYPKLRIEVAGHTDNVGKASSNQLLSQGRAQAVADYMIQVAPELKMMLTAKGYGETMPKADNKTAAGRKLNRRTELQVLNKEVLKEYNP